MLQVLDFRPLVTMTANSYMVFGLRPVTVWLSAVVSADWTHNKAGQLPLPLQTIISKCEQLLLFNNEDLIHEAFGDKQ